MSIVSKVCTHCHEEKPLTEFHKCPKGKHGTAAYCKPCAKVYMKKYYAKNKAKIQKTNEAYYQKHREKTLKYVKEYHSIPENKQRYRDLSYQRRFGITIEDYELMHAEQGGVCKICGGTEDNEYYGRLAVDHCHNTEAVRGLLCHRCNTGIGLFNDDPETIRRAIEYLKAYSQKGPHSEGTE